MRVKDQRKAQSGPEHIGSILRRVLKAAGITSIVDRDKVARTFYSCLPKRFEKHVEVVSYRDNVLTVEVDSNTLWYDLSNFHRERLLRDVRRNVPDDIFVRDIRFVVSKKREVE